MSLARSTTLQSQRSITYDMSIIDESITAPPVEELLEKGVDPDDEYEGIRNRGWVCALGSFMINFFLSGSTLTFGNYMNKQVFTKTLPPLPSHTSWASGLFGISINDLSL